MISIPEPTNWDIKPLDAVAKLTRVTITPDKISHGTKYVGLEHVDGEGNIQFTEVSAGELSSNKFAFTADHILYGKLRPYLRKIARPTLPGICTTEIVPIKPGPKVDRDFLFYYLRQQQLIDWATERCSGANLPRLSPKVLAKFPVPLPPLPEQRRIAAILDQADAIRRKRREAIAMTEELLRSTFLEMFGDPVTNPKGWPVAPLDKGLLGITAGWSAKGENRRMGHDDFGVLKISAVTSGQYRPREYKAVTSSKINKALIIPRRGDLLFSRANTREHVAATCIVTLTKDKLFLPDKLWRIDLDEQCLLPEFLHYCISHPRFRQNITKQATGTSGSMLNISQRKLQKTTFIYPPLDLQKRFREIFWKSTQAKNRLHVLALRVDLLFNSLVQKAFQGKL